ncbi:DUF3054 family protein [Haloarcula marina]|uniref:DUF3054 family protein n=1 Tax=Haloarcula marina TaxID=2961574 RepID=UPI0020B6F888|nr:hypothetical protein [Halomicroarcula marina]
MVSLLPFLVGVGFVAAAVGGLYEVTEYTESQRREERRLVQAYTFGSLLVLVLGLVAAWLGLRNTGIPTWLFAVLTVSVLAVVLVQRRLRKRLGLRD